MNKKLKRNIPILYYFSFFWLALIIIPVIVPLFESKGLTLAQVYYLQAIFAGIVVICEVPSGYIADVLGRKKALIAGSLFHGLGFTWLNFADDFAGLMIFEVLVGIGLSLLSGADLSLLYDSQVAVKASPQEKTRGIANMRTIKSSAEGVAAIIGGLLIVYSFDALILANAIFAWVPLLLTAFLVEAPFVKMEAAKPWVNFKRVIKHMYFEDKMLKLVCLNATFFGLSTFYVIWMLQPYWKEQGIPLTAFGVLWASQCFTVAIVSKLSMWLEREIGVKILLIAIGILPVLGYLGMALGSGIIGIILSYSFFVSRGLNQVILSDALNSRVPSSFRATANSITSFMFRGVYIVTGPLVGLSIQYLGMSVTMLILAGVSAVFCVLYLLPLLAVIKRAAAAPELNVRAQS